MAKKSFNPFKMWGSYIGFVILFIFGVGICIPILFNTCGTFWQEFSQGLQSGYGYLRGLILGSIGFLLGWGINSIFRKVTN